MFCKLILGDCIEKMKEIPDKSVDLVLTDPPYEFVSKNPRGGGFMSKENKKHIEEINKNFGMSFNPQPFLKEIQRILKKFNLYVFTNKNLIKDYIEFANNNNYKFDILGWNKPNAIPIFKGHYLQDIEYIIYISEKGSTFNSNLGYHNYFKFFSFPVGGKRLHPAEKPLKLIEKYISISSNENDIIMDPFAGSGTTGIASLKLNRNCILIENIKDYYTVIKKRLNPLIEQTNLNGQKHELL